MSPASAEPLCLPLPTCCLPACLPAATGTVGRWDVMVRVRGGGQTGQAQAVRHGIARALQAWDPAMRQALKVEGGLAAWIW